MTALRASVLLLLDRHDDRTRCHSSLPWTRSWSVLEENKSVKVLSVAELQKGYEDKINRKKARRSVTVLRTAMQSQTNHHGRFVQPTPIRILSLLRVRLALYLLSRDSVID